MSHLPSHKLFISCYLPLASSCITLSLSLTLIESAFFGVRITRVPLSMSYYQCYNSCSESLLLLTGYQVTLDGEEKERRMTRWDMHVFRCFLSECREVNASRVENMTKMERECHAVSFVPLSLCVCSFSPFFCGNPFHHIITINCLLLHRLALLCSCHRITCLSAPSLCSFNFSFKTAIQEI